MKPGKAAAASLAAWLVRHQGEKPPLLAVFHTCDAARQGSSQTRGSPSRCCPMQPACTSLQKPSCTSLLDLHTTKTILLNGRRQKSTGLAALQPCHHP
jgi:hypothetical protein